MYQSEMECHSTFTCKDTDLTQRVKRLDKEKGVMPRKSFKS